MKRYDLVVIGAGPAGYFAALQAAKLGKRVACVDKEHVGGLCLNWGCIPSKALLKSATLYTKMQHAQKFGLSCDKVGHDFAAIMQRSRNIVEQLRSGAALFLKNSKIDVFQAQGKISSPGKVLLKGGEHDGQTLEGDKLFICTGCKTRGLPGLEWDADTIMSSRQVLALKKQPKSMVIIGAGAIGVEFASFFNALGTHVTLLEALPRILPIEDHDVSTTLQASLQKQGIQVYTETLGQNIERTKKGVRLNIQPKGQKAQTLEAESLLVAIGVEPVLEGLVTKDVPIQCDPKGYIQVNNRYETSIPGIYAAGDIIGPPWLAHVAEHTAKQAILGMFTDHIPSPPSEIAPGCTYCQPQVGSIGLTEARAKEKGIAYTVGKAQFSTSATAMANGQTEGFVKLLFGKEHKELLGAHIIGSDATELITECVLALKLEATAEELAHTMHAHPTLSESIAQAAATCL